MNFAVTTTLPCVTSSDGGEWALARPSSHAASHDESRELGSPLSMMRMVTR